MTRIYLFLLFMKRAYLRMRGTSWLSNDDINYKLMRKKKPTKKEEASE
jgi:hypothetical protein